MNQLWKVGHVLYLRGGVLRCLSRIIELLWFIVGGHAISVKASIGENTVFYHRGVGCVVHDKTVIGSGCHIFQNVTLGSKWSNGVCEGGAPITGNNVMIGAGACVLGEVTVGDNSVIGANSVIIEDIPCNCTVVGVPGKIVKNLKVWAEDKL